MSDIPAYLRRQVTDWAQSRCEYCLLSQSGQEATFHVDHVVPRVDGGETTLENLALACVSCSLRKGHRRTAIDPETGKEVRLYSPRQDSWHEHFRWNGVLIDGVSACGRATIALLQLNRRSIVVIRHEEAFFGRHPPS